MNVRSSAAGATLGRRAKWIAGVDVGGTFTDLIIYRRYPDEEVRLAKVPTTFPNQAVGVVAAIAATGITPADLDLVVHGTTVTTNAVLERKVAIVGLITTLGFRDTLELGRRTRPKPYGMFGTFEPLIPRERRLEVDKRMDAALSRELFQSSRNFVAPALCSHCCEPVRHCVSSEDAQSATGYEVTLYVEGVVDGRMRGEKTLGRSRRLEPLHLPLSSPDRLMRVFRAVVLAQSLLVPG